MKFFVRWAKQLDLDKDLGNFARIQPFKWCMWSLGIIPGPNMSEQRLEIAKVVSFIYMVDDIFDSHQRFDELYLFTEAVIRYVKYIYTTIYFHFLSHKYIIFKYILNSKTKYL